MNRLWLRSLRTNIGFDGAVFHPRCGKSKWRTFVFHYRNTRSEHMAEHHQLDIQPQSQRLIDQIDQYFTNYTMACYFGMDANIPLPNKYSVRKLKSLRNALIHLSKSHLRSICLWPRGQIKMCTKHGGTAEVVGSNISWPTAALSAAEPKLLKQNWKSCPSHFLSSSH